MQCTWSHGHRLRGPYIPKPSDQKVTFGKTNSAVRAAAPSRREPYRSSFDQRLQPLNEARVQNLQALGLASDVPCQEPQELSEYRVVAGPNGVVDLVALA